MQHGRFASASEYGYSGRFAARPPCGCLKVGSRLLTCSFAAVGGWHDPALALQLIYMTFTRVLGWMILLTGLIPPRRS